MLEFEVGAKVWFVDSNSPNVRLLLVVEEIVKKTISGNTREYVFQLMHKGVMKNISGTKLEGNFFSLREETPILVKVSFIFKKSSLSFNETSIPRPLKISSSSSTLTPCFKQMLYLFYLFCC